MIDVRKTVLALGCVLATGLAASSAMAADNGTLTFTGEITDTTCDVAVNGGLADSTIALPRVSTKSLAKAGDVTGRVFVRMNLSNCSLASPATSSKVHAFWQAAPEINASGRLKNTATAGAATNVEIEMLNDALATIDLGKADGFQNSTVATITGATGGTAELTHYAQYHAIGAATPGLLTSKLQYVLSYN